MIGVGSQVTFAVSPPWVPELADGSQRIFHFCLGRIYRVAEVDQNGVMVLDVSADIDHRFGGFMNDIRVEAEYLREIL